MSLLQHSITTKSALRVISDGAILSAFPSILLALKTLSTATSDKLIKFANVKLLTSFLCIILLQCVARSKKMIIILRLTHFQKMFCYFLASFLASSYPIYFLTHNGIIILLNYMTKIDKCLTDLERFFDIIACMYI